MSIEFTVHRLLETHHEYSPVELLKAENQLSEECEQAWRTGKVVSLDEALADAWQAREILTSARSFVEKLGLVSEQVAYLGVGKHAGRMLAVSSDPLLNELVTHRYRPAQSVQEDLFLDGGRVDSSNALRQAILARDPKRARNELNRVSERIPDYRSLGHAEDLIAALEAPKPKSLAQAFESIEQMQRFWLPAAHGFLGRHEAAELLDPLWRDIGQALEPGLFDPDNPDRHASHAFEQARAWQDLERSVQAVPQHRSQPVLLARLATAEYRLGNRIRALDCWFDLCRLAPDRFADLVESTGFEDPGVARAWQAAMAVDDGEELSAEWFPAWMLIHEPRLARAFAETNGESPPASAFNVVRALQLMPPEEQSRAGPAAVSLRENLQQLHAGLLRAYLRRRELAP